jgi:hypothetical protein
VKLISPLHDSHRRSGDFERGRENGSWFKNHEDFASSPWRRKVPSLALKAGGLQSHRRVARPAHPDQMTVTNDEPGARWVFL